MRSVELAVTSGHRLITDLTHEAASFVADQADGLLSVFVPHATAGVALIETGAGTEPDLADALERLLPTSDIYRHRHGSLGHGRDHVMPAFVSPSLDDPGHRGAAGTRHVAEHRSGRPQRGQPAADGALVVPVG